MPRNQLFPENRVCHRYRTQPPIEVVVKAAKVVKGLCRDIGIRGACVTLPIVLAVGDEVRLIFNLPDFDRPMDIHAVVRNKSGSRYGFEFLRTTSHDRQRIETFGRDSTISAFLFTPNPDIVWNAQQVLQDMGVTQVWKGTPSQLPVPNPHIIIIDSNWPDFVEVAQLLRSESPDSRVVIIALLDRTVSSKEVAEMGADMILYKPLPRNWVERVLGTAVKLLRGDEYPPQQAASGK